MGKIAVTGIIGGMLIVSAIQDGLYKKISVWVIGLAFLATCICIPFCNLLSLGSRIGGLIVGLSIMLLSKITGGKIGMGDGLVLCVIGIGLGLWQTMEVVALALFFAAILSIILLSFGKADRKKKIAFVPFLLLAYVLILII